MPPMQKLRVSTVPVLLFLLVMVVESGCRPVVDPVDPGPGIPLELATDRAGSIQDLRYDLAFTIPAQASEPISGRVVVRFRTDRTATPLVLDFAPGADFVKSVSTAAGPSDFRVIPDHIIVPARELTVGENAIEVVFTAGEAALNRNSEFMYTLFVPARAHLSFPSFDQPDLKARYTLELTVPSEWEAVANGQEESRENSNDGVRIRYAETAPISTYLFAFAAGKFQVETAERDGRTYRMFHRETDEEKVARNRDAVFDLHATALAWLEDYTAIDYPFDKFDFVLIPSFQFGGMEHPGAIFYGSNRLLLDESATQNQMLGRASVIAHETSHMWFGDLVTMRWFDDVWMKEVFANFMAAKIVNPSFPEVNHDLRFLVAHYPAAYAVDRTPGTHPIRQELANLNEAGSLYGAIIYQKAPIVMRQLELILGQEAFREGLQVYLDQNRFGNATWTDLVRIFDERSEVDVHAWSRAWVEEAGRPSIRTELEVDPEGRIERLAFLQADPDDERDLVWTQQVEVLLGTGDQVQSIPLEVAGERSELAGVAAMPRPEFILPTGGGLAYGGFTLDDRSRAFLLERLADLEDPVTRGAAWVTLWEEVLEGRIRAGDFLDLALDALRSEDTEQNVGLVLGYVNSAFWRFLPDTDREAVAPTLERAMRAELARSASSSMKSTYFSAFRGMVTTDDGIGFLERVWRRQENIPGVTLSESDEASMALQLAVRSVPESEAILAEQVERFTNPDRKARFEFVIPALSADQETRDEFFRSLSNIENRRREPWVLEGMRYLNHPLRARGSEHYLEPALGLLEEIRRTGDIFFPRNWVGAALGGHDTRSAAGIVRAFLANHPDYPLRLRQIILQSADNLFRAAELADKPGS